MIDFQILAQNWRFFPAASLAKNGASMTILGHVLVSSAYIGSWHVN